MQKKDVKPPLVLVDGSSYLYRAFHALPPLANSKGRPTGAVYGLTNMLRKLLSDYEPDYIAVVFDAKGKTFRDDLYVHYKAHRKAMPDDLTLQVEPTYEIIEALGLPLLVIEGVEADDVIGTLAKQAEQHGLKTLISTSDKDMAQLVDANITLVNTMTGNCLDIEKVTEKFGIPPERMIDYLTLVGDPIDNIPGVPQVGPKTASKWLQQYGSLDEIIKQATEITGKVGENLRTSLNQLPLSKQLATIKLNVPLPVQFDELKRSEPQKEKLIQLFQELEFKTWLTELLEEKTDLNQDSYSRYETITSDLQWKKWYQKLSNAPAFAFKTEVTEQNYMNANLVGCSFALNKEEIAYLPLAQPFSDEKWLDALKTLLENPNIKKIGHNLKFDMEILANYQIELKGISDDVMLESYILDSSHAKHELEALSLKYLGRKIISYTDIAGKGLKQLSHHQISLADATKFTSEQADMTLQLHQILWPRIEKEKALTHVYKKIELPLLPVLARMERKGVLIDATMLEKQTVDLEKRLQEIEKEIFTLAEVEFNINSPKQLQEILFNKLKLPIFQKTPKGQPSTADAVLQELALEFRLPNLIIEQRSLSKLITTYTKKLPLLINEKTNRIHTCYNQTIASTGRLSSSDPNLQNIPIRTEEGRRIRQAFIAPRGFKIITADYSQIELRIMAHISEDPTLLKAFEQGLDIHLATAAEVLSIPFEQVSYEERRKAKVINFGLMYGMSAFGLGKELGLDREAAQKYIDRYFARYPKVKEYMQMTCARVRETGYVETLMGRRLYLPEIKSSQIPRQKAAERAAINAPLQGTAADILKLAMISIDHYLLENKLDASLIMQVHDELVFEVAIPEVDKMKKIICEHMLNAAQLKVPLTVSIGVGDNWDSASKASEIK